MKQKKNNTSGEKKIDKISSRVYVHDSSSKINMCDYDSMSELNNKKRKKNQQQLADWIDDNKKINKKKCCKLTRDGLLRRPGVKSASSSLNVALFAEKFNPFSPQYENPDTAVSL